MKQPCSVQQKVVLDVVLIAVGAGLLWLALPFSVETAGHEPPPVFLGLYVIYLGVLFLLSYFYSHASYLLGLLIWICEHFTHPRGRHMAFIYFGLSLVLGICALCSSFGLIRWGR